ATVIATGIRRPPAATELDDYRQMKRPAGAELASASGATRSSSCPRFRINGAAYTRSYHALPNCLRSSSFARINVFLREAGRFLPARLMEKVSMESAERKGLLFRRVLLSADRFNDAAIRLGSRDVNTPLSRVSASLCSVTCRDQRRRPVRAARRDEPLCRPPWRLR